MNATLTFARLTLHEARSRKILLAAFIFGLAFVALFATGLYFIHRHIETQAPVLQRRLILSSVTMAGLYAANFLTVMASVLVPADTLSGEIGSGVIQTLASKPVRRYEIVLGKWIAFASILAGYLALIAGGVLFSAWAIGRFIPPNISVGLPLMGLGAILLLSLSLAGGTRLSTIANGVMVFGLYGLAFIAGWVEQIGALANNSAARYVGIAASLLVPCESLWRLAAYHMQPPIVRDLQMSPFASASVPSAAMVVWAAVYTAVALAMALWQFHKRNL
jgi:Cu-processing system permease protein